MRFCSKLGFLLMVGLLGMNVHLMLEQWAKPCRSKWFSQYGPWPSVIDLSIGMSRTHLPFDTIQAFSIVRFRSGHC